MAGVEGWLDARWQLVHATHVDAAEIAATAASGAGVVICPGTEGNLGDGFTDLPAWLAADVDLAIGSDSNVTRSWREELRWMEYGQRLRLERRNVCATPGVPGKPVRPQPDTAASLFERARAGGGRAAGHARWGLSRRARRPAGDRPRRRQPARPAARALARRAGLLEPGPAVARRDGGGALALRKHHHAHVERISAAFAQAMAGLWAGH